MEQTLLAKPSKFWKQVMTNRSRACGGSSSLPRVPFEGNLLEPANFLSEELINLLQLWQHDAQFIRWCRLIIQFRRTNRLFSIYAYERSFDLHSEQCFVYRARRDWIPLSLETPLVDWLSERARRELGRARTLGETYSLWYKGKPKRVHLFLETRGDSFICNKHKLFR